MTGRDSFKPVVTIGRDSEGETPFVCLPRSRRARHRCRVWRRGLIGHWIRVGKGDGNQQHESNDEECKASKSLPGTRERSDEILVPGSSWRRIKFHPSPRRAPLALAQTSRHLANALDLGLADGRPFP